MQQSHATFSKLHILLIHKLIVILFYIFFFYPRAPIDSGPLCTCTLGTSRDPSLRVTFPRQAKTSRLWIRHSFIALHFEMEMRRVESQWFIVCSGSLLKVVIDGPHVTSWPTAPAGSRRTVSVWNKQPLPHGDGTPRKCDQDSLLS